MPTFEPFDVVAVPFPYVERAAHKRRPAVVVSRPIMVERHGLMWVVMVTSADNPPWADDVPITDLAGAGLPKPSVVRPVKIATVEAHRCDRLGRLAPATAASVAGAVRGILPSIPAAS
jgi:mRNA interferase MazF